MQASGIVVDLYFVEHVDMRLTGELRRCHLIEVLVDVFARFLAEDTDAPRDATVL